MSEKDNTPEHEPVASPTPEPAPEPAPESVAEPVAVEHPASTPEAVAHDAVARPEAAEPEAAHEATDHAPESVAEHAAEMPPPADNAPSHDEPVESSNLPTAPLENHAPAEDHAEAHATPVEPEHAPEPAVDAVPEAEVHHADALAPVADHDHVEPEAHPAAEPVAPPVVDVTEGPEPDAPPPASPEPEHGIDPAVAAAGAVAVGAAAGAAAAASQPIWSDQGDAPFDDNLAPRPASTDRRERKRESGGFMAELLDIVRTVIYALLIALVVRVFFFQPFTIPSASMEPNLYEGDYIVVSKWSYGYSRHSMPLSPPLFEGRLLDRSAARGDIVVFKRPNNNGEGYTDYIKRIIGLPGDTVQMIANRLYINGELVPDVVVEATQVRGAFEGQTPIQLRETLPGGHEFRIQDFGPGSPSDDTDAFTIPAGHYFVMGDNRDDSMDSRYVWEAGGVGLVPHENLVGKAQIILFSWTPGARLAQPWTWFTHVRTDRFFTDLE